jgi:hypothetical protein
VDIIGSGIHWIDFAGESTSAEVVKDDVSDLALITGHADHRDRARRKELLEHELQPPPTQQTASLGDAVDG